MTQLLQFPVPATEWWGTWAIGGSTATPEKQKPRKQKFPVYAVGVKVECCAYVFRAGGKRNPRWREGVISRIQHIGGVTWYTIPAANGFPFMYTSENVRFPALIRPETQARRLA